MRQPDQLEAWAVIAITTFSLHSCPPTPTPSFTLVLEKAPNHFDAPPPSSEKVTFHPGKPSGPAPAPAPAHARVRSPAFPLPHRGPEAPPTRRRLRS
ncbi:unnamed protein product [Rangifer tarandus platyrhynchus]|uniref:Uncharacterized protein n=1 Tax=Rangifer tarandus platyrhynchus TaxID=3082113 RepID=A0AC59Z604_RANTA